MSGLKDPCINGKKHKWCNHPEHNHCVVCYKLRYDWD